MSKVSKASLKFGGKSGILPKPRAIFKTPYKHEVRSKQSDTGYADGILHPKGTSRELLQPKVITPEERLAKSASAPKREYTKAEIGNMSEEQRFKVMNAEMRRQYLKESYQREVKKLAYQEKLGIEQSKINTEKNEELAHHEQSKAELYTLPTIESMLEGPMVRERTPEEKEMIQLKREHNRFQTQLNVDSQRADKLLELYNSAANFAITEDKLQELVSDAFSENSSAKQEAIAAKSDWSDINAVAFDNKLIDTIMDRVYNAPGHLYVEDTLNGYADDIQELASIVREEQNSLNMQKASERAEKYENLKKDINSEL
ncbi:mitochondrial 37S ribosomal protein [Martiniozyma asiatica (nom. inval.)]|nr:mitochondrial 37S ribosomal protein [Martiniozyma asiatica]